MDATTFVYYHILTDLRRSGLLVRADQRHLNWQLWIQLPAAARTSLSCIIRTTIQVPAPPPRPHSQVQVGPPHSAPNSSGLLIRILNRTKSDQFRTSSSSIYS